MEPYKEQRRELRTEYKQQSWLTTDEQRLAVRAYRLMRNDIDLDELYDVYEALVKPANSATGTTTGGA